MTQPDAADWEYLMDLRDAGKVTLRSTGSCRELRDRLCTWPAGWFLPGDPKERCTIHAAQVARERGLT